MKDIKFIFKLTKKYSTESKFIYERIFSMDVDFDYLDKSHTGISEGLVTILDVYGIGKYNGEIYGVDQLLQRIYDVQNGTDERFWYSENPDMTQHSILFLTYKKGEEDLKLEKVISSNLCKHLGVGKYKVNLTDFINLLISFKEFILTIDSKLEF